MNDELQPTNGAPALKVSYNHITDVLTVDGVNYAGAYFRGFGSGPIGSTVRIRRREHGNVTVEQLAPGSTVPEADAP